MGTPDTLLLRTLAGLLVTGAVLADPLEDALDNATAEIEQAVVAALYAAHAQKKALATHHIITEVEQTKPLSIVMRERISVMRTWAAERTVPCD